jgi:hypothetical protein
VAKTEYTLHDDGSITFHGDVSDEVRQKAYAEAARARAAATEVDPKELETLAVESASVTAERAHATDVEEAKKK